jgi:hypothetical protein
MRKDISQGVLVLWLIGSASALNAQGQRPIPTPVLEEVVINGQSITANVLAIDGKHFVAMEDLAQGLKGAISYGNETIALTFSQPAPQEVKHDFGRIKGTVTYLFNRNYGNRPDTGSKVWLIDDYLDIANDEAIIGADNGFSVVKGGKTVRYHVFKRSVVDGNGNFDLSDVPSGHYTLIVQSNHSNATTMRDVGGTIRLRDVLVKTGETVDASTSFGATAF